MLCAGAFDAQDGPATTEAWIHALPWPGQQQFAQSRRHIWREKAGADALFLEDDTQAGAPKKLWPCPVCDCTARVSGRAFGAAAASRSRGLPEQYGRY